MKNSVNRRARRPNDPAALKKSVCGIKNSGSIGKAEGAGQGHPLNLLLEK